MEIYWIYPTQAELQTVPYSNSNNIFLQNAKIIFHFWLIESSTLHHTWSKIFIQQPLTIQTKPTGEWSGQLKQKIFQVFPCNQSWHCWQLLVVIWPDSQTTVPSSQSNINLPNCSQRSQSWPGLTGSTAGFIGYFCFWLGKYKSLAWKIVIPPSRKIWGRFRLENVDFQQSG